MAASPTGFHFTQRNFLALATNSSVIIEEISDSLPNSDGQIIQENQDDMENSGAEVTDIVDVSTSANDDSLHMRSDADTESPLTDLAAYHSETQTGLLQIATGVISEPSNTAVGSSARKRNGKVPAPIDTSTLRRSNYSNKYDGFRTKSLSEVKATKSKVKPRTVPSATSMDSAVDPYMQMMNE